MESLETLLFRSLLHETFLATFKESLTKSATGVLPWLKSYRISLRTTAKTFPAMKQLLYPVYKRTQFDMLAAI